MRCEGVTSLFEILLRRKIKEYESTVKKVLGG